jgi:kynureninase
MRTHDPPEDCPPLDAADPLAPLREQFDLPPGVIYLDGNSLGVLPRATAARVPQVVHAGMGQGLIRSWNTAGWIALPQRVGDKIARLVGAGRARWWPPTQHLGQPVQGAERGAEHRAPRRPQRRVIVSERSNFPTDLYIAEALCRERGCTLQLVEPDERSDAALTPDVAVLMLTHVNYRTGACTTWPRSRAAAHAAGALTVWDLAHSAGAVPVDLNGANADFAVGCGYKYLNGGPGAPAFVWVHPRHADRFWQPLAGWMGPCRAVRVHARLPAGAPGITRYLCGTPPII